MEILGLPLYDPWHGVRQSFGQTVVMIEFVNTLRSRDPLPVSLESRLASASELAHLGFSSLNPDAKTSRIPACFAAGTVAGAT
jgi:hypothetical protein